MGGEKKPTTVASRGRIVKIALSATRPDGVAARYDDDAGIQNLQRFH
jgi:hypothetical protein